MSKVRSLLAQRGCQNSQVWNWSYSILPHPQLGENDFTTGVSYFQSESQSCKQALISRHKLTHFQKSNISIHIPTYFFPFACCLSSSLVIKVPSCLQSMKVARARTDISLIFSKATTNNYTWSCVIFCRAFTTTSTTHTCQSRDGTCLGLRARNVGWLLSI